MNNSMAVIASLLFISSAAVSGCSDADIRYQTVRAACAGAQPRNAQSEALDLSSESLLTPECKAALNAVLSPKMDEASFAMAPAGYRDRFLEAFAAVATVPLKLPADYSVLGKGRGIVPLSLICILEGQKHDGACLGGQTSCPLGADDPELENCNLFHFLLDVVDHYRYGGLYSAKDPDIFGENSYESDLTTTVSVYGKFWPGTGASGTLLSSMHRAAGLAHEALHSRNYVHITCNGFDCDPELNGPYGFEAIIAEAFVRGGWGEISIDPFTPRFPHKTLTTCWLSPAGSYRAASHGCLQMLPLGIVFSPVMT